MSKLHRLVVSSLDDQRCAMHLPSVERAVRVVEIAPLPKAPDVILGVINLQGGIIPVVSLRRRGGGRSDVRLHAGCVKRTRSAERPGPKKGKGVE